MPSFDISSDVDMQEIDNALNQASKEILTRFDFRNKTVEAELNAKEGKILLTAEDAHLLKGLHDIVINRLAKREVDLRNVDRGTPAISSVGHARQELTLKRGLDGDKAKEIIQAVKAGPFKVQCALQDRQIRVTGKKRDELQEVIAFLRGRDFGVGLGFGNFRE